jgi:hypothetical protein
MESLGELDEAAAAMQPNQARLEYGAMLKFQAVSDLVRTMSAEIRGHRCDRVNPRGLWCRADS